MQRQDIIDGLSKALGEISEIEVFLYGSQARGEATATSDIDLLILLPDRLTVRERIELERKIHGIMLPLEEKWDIDISPVILQHRVWNARETPFTINVTKDRIRI